jgi:hypothetical protein
MPPSCSCLNSIPVPSGRMSWGSPSRSEPPCSCSPDQPRPGLLSPTTYPTASCMSTNGRERSISLAPSGSVLVGSMSTVMNGSDRGYAKPFSTRAAARFIWCATMSARLMGKRSNDGERIICFVVHGRPVQCSWMNAVEPWFSPLLRKCWRIAVFASKEPLRANLDQCIQEWNQHAYPLHGSINFVAMIMAEAPALAT